MFFLQLTLNKGVHTFIGHGEHAPSIVYIIWMKFIGKGDSPPNGLAPFATRFFGSIACLNHKAFNVPMKGRPVIGSGSCEGQEVEGRAGRSIAKDFHLQIPYRGVNGDRHSLESLVALLERFPLGRE
jgi:hypothetical protein